MIKHFFVLFLFMLALQIEASVDKDHQKRVEWVVELKSFLLDLEANNPAVLTSAAGRNFLQKFSFFAAAIASGNYECFYAGWPSTLVKSGGKKLCQNPASGNSQYQNGTCGSGQLQCQPMIFGKNLCVGFSSKKEKQLAFAACESQFKQSGNYDFLKHMTPEEKSALKEISHLAHEICVTGSIGIQKSKPMCQSLISKLKESLTSIERAPAVTEVEVIDEVKVNEELKNVLVAKQVKQAIINPSEVICEDPIVQNSQQVLEVANHEGSGLYETIKNEFLASPLCEPEKVMNDPKDRLSPILFTQVMEDMRFIVKTEPYLTREIKILKFKDLAKNYNLSQGTIDYGESMLKNAQDNSEGRFQALARIRGVMLQEMDKISKTTPGYQAELIKEKLVERKIFTEDAEGAPQCPFVSEDAFREAMAGREAILKTSHKNKLTSPDVITIVDYSRPSNERRMFVIDVKTKKVLHNTWVGHGGGKDRTQEGGIDNFGSSPQTSNANGSYLSSEGFYIARTASSGGTYLNNVTLEGIDVNNKSMGGRGLIVHGWRTPGHEYVNKSWVMNDKKQRQPGEDLYQKFMQIDFKTTDEDLFNLTQEISAAAAPRDRVDATDGCLGVPDTQMGHIDRKGRKKSQLELLREDLPGTLMFNYTGAGKTNSQYLK